MRGGFPQGQMQRHRGAADLMLRLLALLTKTSLSLFDQVPNLLWQQKERSSSDGGYAFLDKIPLDFPISQRRKEQAVCWFRLGGFVLVPHSTRQYLGTAARFS
jgi:hypothetical protein